jgi:hypothetical protein
MLISYSLTLLFSLAGLATATAKYGNAFTVSYWNDDHCIDHNVDYTLEDGKCWEFTGPKYIKVMETQPNCKGELYLPILG